MKRQLFEVQSWKSAETFNGKTHVRNPELHIHLNIQWNWTFRSRYSMKTENVEVRTPVVEVNSCKIGVTSGEKTDFRSQKLWASWDTPWKHVHDTVWRHVPSNVSKTHGRSRQLQISWDIQWNIHIVEVQIRWDIHWKHWWSKPKVAFQLKHEIKTQIAEVRSCKLDEAC